MITGESFVTADHCQRTHRLWGTLLTVAGALLAGLVAGLVLVAQAPADHAKTAITIAQQAAASSGRVETVLSERTAGLAAQLESIRAQLAKLERDVEAIAHNPLWPTYLVGPAHELPELGATTAAPNSTTTTPTPHPPPGGPIGGPGPGL